MTAPNHRHERIGEEIAHEINAMLAGELKDPRLEISVVVNEVRLAPDGRNARVFIGARGIDKIVKRGARWQLGSRFELHHQCKFHSHGGGRNSRNIDRH